MTGIQLIAAERRAHVEREGWTNEHDDQYENDELINAAGVYMSTACTYDGGLSNVHWPWHEEWFKPGHPVDGVRCLVKAASLITAEIDRRLRAQGEYVSTPRIVCLCGSTRFWRDFQKQSLLFTLRGDIVLSIGAATGTDAEHFGNLPKAEYDQMKRDLDELHKRKIEMSNFVYVLNVGGYIGESTRSEIEHAKRLGIPVEYLE